MKKVLLAALGLLVIIGVLAGCSANPSTNSNDTASNSTNNSSASSLSGSISADGSSALLPLAQLAADQFESDNPNVSVTVNGGGSGTGLNDVLSGTVDIGNSDVYANEKLDAANAEKLVDHKVCLIGVALVVNSDLATTVSNLTSDQLTDIFVTGKITNWSQLGGPNEPITIVNRPGSSGTRALFQKWALGGQTSLEGSSSLQTDDSNALLAAVGQTPGSIGYLALSYLTTPPSSISIVQIDGVSPTYANIYNNKYQVWGYEHMYTSGQPTALVQAFLDYMTSPDMLATAEAHGYGDPTQLNAAAASSR